MSYDMDFADDLDEVGGDYLNEPGVYHLMVEEVREGVGQKGTAIDGFSVSCIVRAGTTQDCAGKSVDLGFFSPNYSKGDKSVASTKRQNTAFALATNLIDPNAMGTKATIELKNAEGCQLVVKLNRKMDKDPVTEEWTVPSKFLQISYSDIWHVDDPAAEKHPKDATAIAVIPKAFRRAAEWFAFKAKKGAVAAPAQAKPVPPASDFSSL